jgi:uncharacterized protein (DUF2225 family)
MPNLKKESVQSLCIMTEKPCKLRCPVCKTEWMEALASSAENRNLAKELRIPSPCGHGEAFLLRFYDVAYGFWYYEQLDFIMKQ